MSELTIINDTVFINGTFFSNALCKYIDNSAKDIEKMITEELLTEYYSVNGIYKLFADESSTQPHTAFLSGMVSTRKIYNPYDEFEYNTHAQFCEYTHQETYLIDARGYLIDSSRDLIQDENRFYDFFELLDSLLFLGVPIDHRVFRELFLEVSKNHCNILTFEKDDMFYLKKIRLGSVSDLIDQLRKRHHLDAALLKKSTEGIDAGLSQETPNQDIVSVPESTYKVIFALLGIIEDKLSLKRNAIQLEIQERHPNEWGLKKRNIEKIFGTATKSME
ncbi:hypothetical protein [Alteromonas sp. W364]|uniref:hypothetical protein n=1 Tax=Alteromonas sp. W364 TaxID=3075610 RepID=UPI002885BB87|nr:hypothetical protein [Alteromonas sp. W364]MDT0626889.1 hypothetical protein [Alteromonas sp. W364]